MQHISAGDLLKKLEQGERPRIIDVREPAEWDYYHMEEAELIPMHSVPDRIGEIPAQPEVYIICGHGVRSQTVIRFLEHQGRNNAVNVIGGMAAVGSLRGFPYDG